MVTDGERRHALAELGDHAGTLVAHHQGSRGIPFAALHVQIRVAHAGGRDLDADLSCARPLELHLGDLDGGIGVGENGGLHGTPCDESRWGNVSEASHWA